MPVLDPYNQAVPFDSPDETAEATRAIGLDFLQGMADDDPACAVCGCTEDFACLGGCSWAADPVALQRDVCSRCAAAIEEFLSTPACEWPPEAWVQRAVDLGVDPGLFGGSLDSQPSTINQS